MSTTNKQPGLRTLGAALVVYAHGHRRDGLGAKIPEIKTSLGLSDDEIGLVLVSSSVGAFNPETRLKYVSADCAISLLFVGLGRASMDVTSNSQVAVIDNLKFLVSPRGAWNIYLYSVGGSLAYARRSELKRT